MKIYLFNPENGVYLGEDFADEAPTGRGERLVPPDSTTITPPTIENGQVLVFNAVEQRWEVRHHSGSNGKNTLNSIKQSEDNRHGKFHA